MLEAGAAPVTPAQRSISASSAPRLPPGLTSWARPVRAAPRRRVLWRREARTAVDPNRLGSHGRRRTRLGPRTRPRVLAPALVHHHRVERHTRRPACRLQTWAHGALLR